MPQDLTVQLVSLGHGDEDGPQGSPAKEGLRVLLRAKRPQLEEYKTRQIPRSSDDTGSMFPAGQQKNKTALQGPVLTHHENGVAAPGSLRPSTPPPDV